MSTTWIIVPLYNEEATVRAVIEQLIPLGANIVVVDDGSTDAGIEALYDLAITVIRHPFNLGQGAALRTGFEYALSAGAEFAATFDSDGQYVPDDISQMLEHLVTNQLDIVTGSRFLGRTENMPLDRCLLIHASRVLARMLSGLQITDTQNGVRVLNRKALSNLLFNQDRMAHAMEVWERVAKSRLRHSEFPNTMIYTEYSMAKGQGNIVGSFNILADLLLARL